MEVLILNQAYMTYMMKIRGSTIMRTLSDYKLNPDVEKIGQSSITDICPLYSPELNPLGSFA